MHTLRSLILIALATLGALAQADLLTLQPGSQVLDGVPVANGATANIGGKSLALTTVGAGPRWHTWGLIPIEVYVLQLMVDNPGGYVKSYAKALASIDAQTSIAIRMTFLYPASPKDMQDAYRNGLTLNSADGKAAEAFENLVTTVGTLSRGGSLTILITRNADGTVTLQYENANGTTVQQASMQAGPSFMHDVAAIWLGQSNDQQLLQLKEKLAPKP